LIKFRKFAEFIKKKEELEYKEYCEKYPISVDEHIDTILKKILECCATESCVIIDFDIVPMKENPTSHIQIKYKQEMMKKFKERFRESGLKIEEKDDIFLKNKFIIRF
jgi:hypothetical protein